MQKITKEYNLWEKGRRLPNTKKRTKYKIKLFQNVFRGWRNSFTKCDSYELFDYSQKINKFLLTLWVHFEWKYVMGL